MTVIALLGPDGSGKSTLINELKRGASGEVELHHFKISLGGNQRPPVTEPYDKPPHPGAVAFLKVLWWHLVYMGWGFRHTFRHRADDRLVIFDRHLFDVAADPRRYRVPVRIANLPWRRITWPKPDLTVILQLPVAVVRERKQEVAEEETAAQLKAYEDLPHGPDKVLRVTEALSSQELARLVWVRLAEK